MSKEDRLIISEKSTNMIIEQHIECLKKVFTGIILTSLAKMKSKLEAKHYNYQWRQHQNACEEAVSKTLEIIEIYLREHLETPSVIQYRQIMLAKQKNHIKKIDLIKKLADQIVEKLRDDQIHIHQQKIKRKLHQYKHAQLDFIPNVEKNQDQNFDRHIKIMKEKLQKYDDKYQNIYGKGQDDRFEVLNMDQRK